MALKKCIASQWIINIDPNAFAYQYDVDIVYERSEGQKPLFLSKNNNCHFKYLCRTIIRSLDSFNDLVTAYDGCTLLWTPKALKNNIDLTIAQSDIDNNLQQYLADPNGVLHISLKKAATIMTSDFTNTVNAALVEDRSWRNLMELVLSEDAITRERNPYVMHGPGCLIETAEHRFQSGLVYREGNFKGAHIIQGNNGPQMALAMDCCRKVFFPSNSNFMEFLNKFMNDGMTLAEAESLCWGLKLHPNDNSRRLLHFKAFTTIDGVQCAVMREKDETFPVEELEIVPDQSVPLDAMPKKLKEQALDLNCFKPHDRKRCIQQQFQKLQLNNGITAAFGVWVEEEMLDGTFDDSVSVDIVVENGQVLAPDGFGAFKLNSQNYYRRGNYKKFILLATQNDRDRAIEGVRKIVSFATGNRETNAMIMFERFDTTATTLSPWVNVLNKFRGAGNIVITVDETPESHDFLKFAEAVTGVTTQHLKLSTASNVRFQTCQNIVHKLNIKSGGLNHMVRFSNKVPNLDINKGNVFVIGMDVCHPTGDNYKGATLEPSFVGLAANYMKHPEEFGDLMFAQTTRQELIDSRPLTYFVQKMLAEAQKFRKINTIVLVRDGVSEGQYSQVLQFEIAAIRAAAKNLSMEVKIIAFIVTKNGNTRHFHESPDGRINSMPPRSFVNFGTRHGFEQFYMTAHRSCKGTAKTIMITKICDEVGISLAEAEEFMLGLTYLHQIVSLPISLPTPVSQADAIAQRGQKLYRTLQKYCSKKVPRNADGTIDNKKLTELLSISNEDLPANRYNA